MVFDNAFCTNGICAPSRAVVLTGKHSHLNGVRDNSASFDGAQATFPKYLQAAGYETALIGKWHLKSDPTGFDHWEVLPGQGHYYNPDFKTATGTKRREGYVTDLTTDLTIEWLEGRADKDAPFLMMSHHKAPHRPWFAGPEHLDTFDGTEIPEPSTLFDDYATRSDAARNQEMSIEHHMYTYYDLKVPPLEGQELQGADRWTGGLYERMTTTQRAAWEAAYASENAAFRANPPTGKALVAWKYQRYIKEYLRCIASVDDNVGRLLDYLEQAGLRDNTIVVYTSDQGFFLGEHGWYDKRFMYEPALRMPLMVSWPGVTKPGTRAAQLVQNLDFAPTFLELAGVEVPTELQGRSLIPVLRGDAPDWRESIYYQYYETGIHAVEPHFGVRTERYKLIRFPGLDAWEFFDLSADPEELHNLFGQEEHAAAIAKHQAELARLREHFAVPDEG